MKKNPLANVIVVFFRAFKISIPLSIILFLILYFFVFQANLSLTPDVSNVKMVVPSDPFTSAEISYGNSQNSKVLAEARVFSVYNEQDLKSKIISAHKEYYSLKLNESLLYSFLLFICLPLLIAVVKIIIHAASLSSNWVENNKTI